MEFSIHEDEQLLRESIRSICEPFTDTYWMEHDNDHEFAWDFYEVMAKAGYTGLGIPEEYGGGGSNLQMMAILIEEICATGGGLNASSIVHQTLFGLQPVIKYGSDKMKQEYLPRAASGELHMCFGITEPDAGTDTTRISTFAEKVPGGYKVNGRKVFISRAQEADRILLITRTAPRDAGKKSTDGMTLFFTDLDRDYVQVEEIPKLGRNVVDTNFLFIDDLFVPEEDRVGEEGQGFKYLLAGLNAERVINAAQCIGTGRAALARTVEYTKNREVFGRPIGMNQGVQFPLADSLAKLDAAEMMTRKAAWLYDNGLPCGREANVAKYLASEAGVEACDRAIQFHGGYGYAKEYHVERYWRDIRVLKVAPIANELVLSYLGEHVLGLPRSY